jgi:hypothetical protein
MRKNQLGMTAIGFMFVAAIIAMFGFAALKVTPMYLENMKVVSLLNDLKANFGGQGATATEIRKAIGKRLNVDMVYGLKQDDFKVAKSDAGYSVSIEYERGAEFIANLSLVANFDNSVEIRR